MRPRLTDEELQGIWKLHWDGMTTKFIEKAYNLASGTVSRITNGHIYASFHPKGAPAKIDSKFEPMSPWREKLLDFLVQNNVTLATIKKEYGFGYTTVRARYPSYRVNGSTWEEGIAEETREMVARLVEEEAPISIITEVTGLTVQMVKRLAPNAGSSAEDVGIYAAAVRQLQEMGVEVK